MFDMVALAYQANLTRVFTFMMAAEGSNLTYNHIGVSDAFHPLSHHQNDKTRKDKLVKIQTYHTPDVFAKFLREARGDAGRRRLDARPLDPAVRQQHEQQQRPQPFPAADAVVGGGSGKIKGGQHLQYPDQTPLANLLLTLLERAGIPVEKVGNSTGVFSEV